MANLLKSNGTYGAQVGHKTVFTKEAALERYKTCLKEVYGGGALTREGSLVLSEVEEDLARIGFTYEELEEIEIGFIKNL